MIKQTSIKFKLTLWYLLVVSILLFIFQIFAYILLSQRVYQNLDDSLKSHSQTIGSSLDNKNGKLSLGDVEIYDQLILLFDSSGKPVEERGSVSLAKKTIEFLNPIQTFKTATYRTFKDSETDYRLYIQPMYGDSTSGFLVIGRNTEEINNVLHNFFFILSSISLGVLLLSGFGGIFLTSRFLQPLERMRKTAETIGANDLSQRITVENTDELSRLALAINNMIERLEGAFKRQKQFTSDASHELRTPLAVIQAESSLALRKKRSPEEYRQTVQIVLRESEQMRAIIEKLLYLARLDQNTAVYHFQNLDVKDLVFDGIREMETLGLEKHIILSFSAKASIFVRADPTALRQVVINILQNALRYTEPGGRIVISLEDTNDEARIKFTDTGIGIAEEHLPHIFDRFYRVDNARTNKDGGSGLGLSICKEIITLHGGTITVHSIPGQGSTFTVNLPKIH